MFFYLKMRFNIASMEEAFNRKFQTVAITHTWPAEVFRALQKEAIKKGFKNFQSYIGELARQEAEKINNRNPGEKPEGILYGC